MHIQTRFKQPTWVAVAMVSSRSFHEGDGAKQKLRRGALSSQKIGARARPFLPFQARALPKLFRIDARNDALPSRVITTKHVKKGTAQPN